jgi:hypothetical protein
LDRTDQQSDKDRTAASDGDLTDQHQFTAALDPGDEVIDLRLKPHNLVATVAVVHGASL